MTLLDAVDSVTKPVASKILREDGTLHTVTLPSLLEQIENAVVSSGKGSAGGGGGATTGSMLNSAAFDEATHIRRTINSWRTDLGLKRAPEIIHGLRDWHMVFIRTDGDHEFFSQEIRVWAAKIRQILDPPRRIELIGPCVVCQATHYPDVDGAPLINPLIVEYPSAMGSLEEVRAHCRNSECGQSWEGVEAIRWLRYEMDTVNTVSSDTP